MNKLVSDYGTPLYVTDLDIVEDRYNNLESSIDIDVKYACKSNFDPLVLNRLQDNDAEFVAGSSYEAMIAYENGVDAGRLQVTAVSPSSESITQLINLSKQSENFTVVINDYDTCRRLCRNGFIGRFLIRLKASKDLMSSEKYSNGSYMKFGMTEEEIQDSIRLIQDSGADMLGFHSHLGGTIKNSDIKRFRDHCENIINRSKNYADLSDIDVINFGGGFGVPEKQGEEDINLTELNSSISSVLESEDSTRYVVEPGRYISAPSTVLLTEVRTVREGDNGRFIGVDAGMSQFPRTTMFDVYHEIRNLSDYTEQSKQTVAGPTCSGADVFCHEREFGKCNNGDILALENVGAYGFVMAGNFHGYPYPTIVDTGGNESPLSGGLE